jgi:hypothetical protein
VPAPHVQKSTVVARSECRFSAVSILISVRLLRSRCLLHFQLQTMQIRFRCTVCDRYSVQAVVEYEQRFPNSRIPTRRVFNRVYQTLQNTGTLPGVRIEPNVMFMKASMKKALFKWHGAVHVRVREELRDVFVFPTRECGEHCMQRACIYTTCSECNISDLAILLRLQFCKWHNGIRELHRYSVY